MISSAHWSVLPAALLIVGGTALFSFIIWRKLKELRREAFIRAYQWPPGLLDRLANKHDGFTRKQTALVGQGLRQFFLAYLKSRRAYVAMPSQAADDLWHEFILYTREYEKFCRAAFGKFLHHTPAVALSKEQTQSNAGLRRVWWQCCREENINPAKPTRVPLLFALDGKLRIANGYVYHPDCEQLRRNGAAGSQCGGDFSSSSIDGATDGFGDPSSSGSSGDSSGDSGSDSGGDSGGGGCGGGGD